jgi:hypothetical protein
LRLSRHLQQGFTIYARQHGAKPAVHPLSEKQQLRVSDEVWECSSS